VCRDAQLARVGQGWCRVGVHLQKQGKDFVTIRPKQDPPQLFKVIVMSIYHVMFLFLILAVFVMPAIILTSILWRLLRLKVVEAERRLQNTSNPEI
jgi:hypothetical protein